jgi:hypothetical protein
MRFYLTAGAAAAALLFCSSAALAGPAGPTLIIRQMVADYAKWRPGYDAHKAARDSAGLENCRVQSSTDDANDVLVICDVTSMDKAKAFTTSKSLADAMKGAGVVGKPGFYFLAAP